MHQSVETGQFVQLRPWHQPQRPLPNQEINRPAVASPELVHAADPGGKS